MIDSNPAACFAIPSQNTFFPDPWVRPHVEAAIESNKVIGEFCLALHLNGADKFHETMRCRRPSHNDLSKDSDLHQILSRNLPYVWNQDLVTGKKLP